MGTTSDRHLEFIEPIAKEDAAGLLKAHESYGDSWKKRGGIGAYMGMIRKFDRMEHQVERYGYDVVKAVEADQRPEGLIDDIRDARRYLMLIESWLREMDLVKAGDHRDNLPERKFAENVNDQLGSYSDLDVDPLENDPKCLAHIPDAKCDCDRCQAMAKITTPHIDDCQCGNCVAVRKTIRKTMDQLKKDSAERAEKRLYEDNSHPVACECAACSGSRGDKAKARGCHPNCGCNNCLADYYYEYTTIKEQNHE